MMKLSFFKSEMPVKYSWKIWKVYKVDYIFRGWYFLLGPWTLVIKVGDL